MQSSLNTHATTGKLRRWLSDALFTGRSAADYFTPLIQAIDPDWSPGRTLATVESIHDETADTKTLVLRPQSHWPAFQAGQHVAIDLAVRGRQLIRTFTIATTPAHFAKTGTLALTIKKTADGRVTPYLHDILRIGQRIGLSQPTGSFLLPENASGPLLYLAAGSGITPVMAHLRQSVEAGFPVPVTLLYYARHHDEFIFLRELQAIAKACPRFRLLTATTQETHARCLQGRIDASHLEQALAKRDPHHVFICGPRGFYDNALHLLQASSAAQVPVTSEHFGGRVVTATSNSVHQIRLENSERLIDGSSQQTLLDTAEANGLAPQAGCRMGICHTCKCKKTEGRVRNLVTGEVSDAGEEMIQLCISTPETDITLAL